MLFDKMNIKILISTGISIVCIILIIISAIKYSNPTFSACNLVSDGYIKALHVAYSDADSDAEKIKGLTIAEIDVYKMGELRFIEHYQLLTNLDDYGFLESHYNNLTVVKLFKKCIGVIDGKYYLEDFHYYASGNWQLVLAHSCLFLIVSLLASCWFFVEIKIKKTESIIES